MQFFRQCFCRRRVQTRAFSGMPADFIKGADISTLLDAEKHGAKFYNHNNQPQDAIAILKADGVNYVRLRLWVDPKDAQARATAAAITIWRPRWRWRNARKRRA
jgi:arabinogalactan endo-1,4-beta-galactosidase